MQIAYLFLPPVYSEERKGRHLFNVTGEKYSYISTSSFYLLGGEGIGDIDTKSSNSVIRSSVNFFLRFLIRLPKFDNVGLAQQAAQQAGVVLGALREQLHHLPALVDLLLQGLMYNSILLQTSSKSPM